jgi:hypothetical protein
MLDVSDAGASSSSSSAGMRGLLLKKAGGKALDKKTRLLDRWHKRWFVLPPQSTTLSYYKSESEQVNGKKPLGELNVGGATIFLKAVVRGQYRFTVQTVARELKLRATTAQDYESWMGALQPLAGAVREDDGLADGLDNMSVADDDDVIADDDEFDPDDEQFARGRGKSVGRTMTISGGSGGGIGGLSPGASLGPASLDRASDSGAMPLGYRGILEKKSGGKAGKSKWRLSEKWSKRWFVLPPGQSVISYYKTEKEQTSGKEALGNIDCAGATVFLKEVKEKSGVHRFTVRTSQRELKLRATNAAGYQAWITAIRPFASSFEEEDDQASMRFNEGAGDDDDDDSD